MTTYKIDRIILESYPTLLTCAILGLVAGIFLESSRDIFLESNRQWLVPMFLMMIPPINGLGGNVGSILGARLTSALHMGTIEPRIRGQQMLGTNITASWIMSLAIFTLTSVIFFGIACSLGTPTLDAIRIAAAFFVAGMMLTAAVIFTAIAAASTSFAMGIDPDNVVNPVITSIVDVLGVICLIFSIQILVV